MRVASYNIMSGGFNSYSYHQPIPERIDLLVEAVQQLDADFVSLIDTFRWDEIYSENDLKLLFNYKYAFCINLHDERLIKLGHNNGLTVLTNENVLSFETIRLSNRNAIKTTIQKEDKTIDLYTVYLDDLLEDVRLEEVNALLLKVNPKNPTIIMGDLNTLSKKDLPHLLPIINQFFDKNPNMAKALTPFLNEVKKGLVISQLENAGFCDTNASQETTAPTPLLGVTDIPSLLRLDYILTNNLNFQDFRVHKDDLFDKVSDHYPVTLEIELSQTH